MRDSGMDKKSIANLFNKFEKVLPKWRDIIEESFLPIEQQNKYWGLIERMAARLAHFSNY